MFAYRGVSFDVSGDVRIKHVRRVRPANRRRRRQLHRRALPRLYVRADVRRRVYAYRATDV
jgi:hypothetical protein